MKFPILELPRERYPPKLLEIPDPPIVLHYRGNPELLNEDRKTLSIVGARACSRYGEEICRRIVSGLARKPITIISGLALGIDSVAHLAALDNKLPTIALPGSGLNPRNLHPPSHRGLAERIIEAGGLLLSEFPADFQATVQGFPQRNRIMAGLSDAVLIIEGERRSGTMITARLALDYNRDVLAVPGSVLSKNSEGPHFLIQTGAMLVNSSEEVLMALGLGACAKTEGRENSYQDCSPEELRVLEYLKSPLSREELIEELELPTQQVNSLLTILELKGLIKESGGDIYLV